jgi:hypothetical protein
MQLRRAIKKVVKQFDQMLLVYNEAQRLEENSHLKTPSLSHQNSGQHLQDAALFNLMLQDLTACPVCGHLCTQWLKSHVANNLAACAAALAAGGDGTFDSWSSKHGCFCHAIHCCRQPNGGNCSECTSKARNDNIPVMVGPGECG